MPTTHGARATLEGVSKRFATGTHALLPVTLEAAPGDFIGLVGPSGCGKTTLLRLLAGLEEPSEGRVGIDEHPPTAARDQLAYIFQDPTLLPWLTAAHNVELPLRLRGAVAEKRREAASSLLQLVGLGGAAGKFPAQLSGGMKMRVSIARALSSKPGLLLLDEPFASLDEITRNRLNEELLNWRAAAPFTAFFVTHSVSEAVFVSNRVLVFSPAPGRIVEEIAVPFSYPRTASLRESFEYQKLVARAAASLREVMQVK